MKKFSLFAVLFIFTAVMPIFAGNSPEIRQFHVSFQNGKFTGAALIIDHSGQGIKNFDFGSIYGVKKDGSRVDLGSGACYVVGSELLSTDKSNIYTFNATLLDCRLNEDFKYIYCSGTARDGSGNITEKKVKGYLVKILPPYVPNNPNPADNATGQKEIIVHWRGGDPNGLPVTYTVLWGYTQPVNTYQLVTADTFAVLSNWKKFPENKTFYWRVIADNGFEKVSGPTWTFDTYFSSSNSDPFTSKNYPNPFNPVTTIQYSLKIPANVQLTVYNSIGQQVATLVNQRQQPGKHMVKFNGTNLASGTYFYRLQIGQKAQTYKMFLLK